MEALEDVFAKAMPPEMGFDYSGMSFQENQARQGISPAVIFGFSLLFVFLILAALYESWSLPLAVLLCTPVAVCGTLAALYLRRAFEAAVFPSILVSTDFDVFAQIGLVMIIGLVAKNAILIIEFAKDESDHGATPSDAALKAARLRLRPILMTSFAFILGCVPLWIAKGSGAISRQIMGTAVIGGMLAASLVAIFLMPAGFVLMQRLAGALRRERPAGATPVTEGAP
jgi:HAE1 family hydrophobic/amphiphilic exporter-1